MPQNTPHPPSSLSRFALACAAIGIVAGIGGLIVSSLLHIIQHWAYGYSTHDILGHVSFLEGVTLAPWWRRLLALSVCGTVAGLGWWYMWRRMRPLMGVNSAVREGAPPMPTTTTLWHVALQIITVGLGSPLGREVAPRELGALSAGHIARWLRLSTADIALLMACGTGAGLAAVYNVPLAGALFSLEVLLGRFQWRMVIPALATSALAAWVAALGLGSAPQYHLHMHVEVAPQLVVWALIAGPLLGAAAYAFSRLTEHARVSAPRDHRLLIFCLINFPLIGAMSLIAPAILGNGKPIVQSCIDGSLTLPMLLIVLLFKLVAVWGSLKSGAHGGLLTPGLAMGAIIGTLGGMLWNSVLMTSIPMEAFVLIAAPAFLAASMRMPMTALALGVELTRVDHSWLAPMVLATAGALATAHLCQQRWSA